MYQKLRQLKKAGVRGRGEKQVLEKGKYDGRWTKHIGDTIIGEPNPYRIRGQLWRWDLVT